MAQAQTDADASPTGRSPQRQTTVRADVCVLVARDAPGDLAAGVRALLGRIDAVAEVDAVAMHGMRPGLNDLRVDATATVRMTGSPTETEAEARLHDGFGVREATVTGRSVDEEEEAEST